MLFCVACHLSQGVVGRRRVSRRGDEEKVPMQTWRSRAISSRERKEQGFGKLGRSLEGVGSQRGEWEVTPANLLRHDRDDATRISSLLARRRPTALHIFHSNASHVPKR